MIPFSIKLNFNGNSRTKRSFPIMILALAQLVLVSGSAFAETPTLPKKTAGRQVALLIGVEKYRKVPALTFVRNDVQRLAEVLRDRAGFDEVVELSDGATDEKKQPVKSTIMDTVSKWLEKTTPKDTVVVYFSGHGFRDPEGNMYLAPLDTDPVDLPGTGVPVTWFRDQIASCKASLKILVLDACHAGSTKGAGSETNFGQQDMAMFEKLEGVVTLASSTGEQPSQMWDEKQQSLFSYWLKEGLKGHADEDGNGEVNIDELYDYVHRNVTQSAEARLHRPQTPVRKIGLGTPGQPVIVYLKPQTLKQTLTEMAQQLADAIASRNLGKVGVLEFTNNTKVGELLGRDYGLLGKYCAEQLEEQLVREQRNRFKVVNRRALQRALQEQQFALADLGSSDALKSLANKTGGMPVVALGILNDRSGRMVTLRCQLIETENNEVATVVGGKAFLNESEWGMLGKSVSIPIEVRRPELPAAGKTGRPIEDVVVDRLDTRADGPHPLSDPKFPFRVWIVVNGQIRQGEFRGNDFYVPLRKGEEFEVYVENKSGQFAMMRLLVDGLNTLPEPDSPATTEDPGREESPAPNPELAAKGLSTEIVGKHVNLDDARAWVLDPNDPDRKDDKNRNTYAVRGWVTKVGKEGVMRRFKIVDVSESLAARRKFTAQLGLITVAFYAGNGSRGNAVGFGGQIDQNLEMAKGQIGNMQGVVHIRYFDPDEKQTAKP